MKMPFTRTEISDVTGFDAGDKFAGEDQVREYFSREQLMRASRGWAPGCDAESPDQDVLDEMAETVIRNRWHCEF